MPASKAQQKAVNKYMAANYDRINLTVPNGEKEIVQAHAAAIGESVNGFIGRAIKETIARDGAEKPADASGSAAATTVSIGAEIAVQAISAPVLPSEQMKQVKAHIAKTGEDTDAFIERAINEQINRDSMAFKLGVNPAKKGGVTND